MCAGYPPELFALADGIASACAWCPSPAVRGAAYIHTVGGYVADEMAETRRCYTCDGGTVDSLRMARRNSQLAPHPSSEALFEARPLRRRYCDAEVEATVASGFARQHLGVCVDPSEALAVFGRQ